MNKQRTLYKVRVTARNAEPAVVVVDLAHYGMTKATPADICTLAEKQSGFRPAMITGSHIITAP